MRFGPYRIDLDVYRIGGQVWLHGGNLYGTLPATASGVRLPFSYPPVAAVLLSPLSLVPMAVAGTRAHAGHDRAGRAGAAGVPPLARLARRSGGAGSWWTVGWLLPAALLLEPVRNTLDYGQVNVALMALVSLDCLAARARWPRGALVGVAAAVKLTPGGVRAVLPAPAGLPGRRRRPPSRSPRAPGPASCSPRATRCGTGRRSSSQTGRPGSPAYAANQSIQGVLARAGLDPHAPAGAAAWLALSAVVLALACRGMRRALAGVGRRVGAVAQRLRRPADLADLLVAPLGVGRDRDADAGAAQPRGTAGVPG